MKGNLLPPVFVFIAEEALKSDNSCVCHNHFVKLGFVYVTFPLLLNDAVF